MLQNIVIKIEKQLPHLTLMIEKEIHKNYILLNEPCKFPIISDCIDQMIKLCNIDKSELKSIAQNFKNKLQVNKNAKLLLLTDHRTHFSLLLMLIYIRSKETKMYKKTFLLMMLRHYGNLMRKYFVKGCIDHHFIQCSGNLKKTHLFVKYKTHTSALIHLTDVLTKKYENTIMTFNIDELFKLVYESRHRINQSIKSFFNSYLISYNDKQFISTNDEKNELYKFSFDSRQQIIDKCSDYILTYNHKLSSDYILLINKITKLHKQTLIHILYKIHYTDRTFIENAYLYMLKDLDNIFMYKNKLNVIKHIRHLMSVKSTKQEIYFKKIIENITNMIIKQDKHTMTIYNNYNNTNKHFVLLSVGLYLGLYINYILNK